MYKAERKNVYLATLMKYILTVIAKNLLFEK